MSTHEEIIEMGRRATSLRTHAAKRARDLEALRSRQEHLDRSLRSAEDIHQALLTSLQEKSSNSIASASTGLFDIAGRFSARRQAKELDAEISQLRIDVLVAQRRVESRMETASESRKDLRELEALQSPADLVAQADALDSAALQLVRTRTQESQSLKMADPRFENIRRSIQDNLSGARAFAA